MNHWTAEYDSIPEDLEHPEAYYGEDEGEDEGQDVDQDEDQAQPNGFDPSRLPVNFVAGLNPEARKLFGLPPKAELDPLQTATDKPTAIGAEPRQGQEAVAYRDQGPAVQDGPRAQGPRSSIQFVEEVTEEIEYLIRDLLPKGAVVLLSGNPGTMKSFLALSMGYAVASGTSWLGRPTKQGRVLYLDGEMSPALIKDRLRGIGTDKALDIWVQSDRDFPQTLDDQGLQRIAGEYALIIVDTLRRFMAGLKENDADDMAQITKGLKKLTLSGATVLALHHSSKNPANTGPRGSSELKAGCDVSLPLMSKRKKGGTLLTIVDTKTRYSSSEDLEILAEKGTNAPVFTIQGVSKKNDRGNNTREKTFLELAQMMEDLRQALTRDPIQKEVLRVAKEKGGFPGKQVILDMLTEGEGMYWQTRHGSKVSYGRVEDLE